MAKTFICLLDDMGFGDVRAGTGITLEAAFEELSAHMVDNGNEPPDAAACDFYEARLLKVEAKTTITIKEAGC